MLAADDLSHQNTSIGTAYFTLCLDERLPKQSFMDGFNYAACMQKSAYSTSQIQSIAAIATRGKSSMGWFFGCKLHLIMNQSGDMVSTALSNGHTADIKMVEQLVEGLKAKLYADRGYISQELKSNIKNQTIDLITYNQKNMKSIQLSTSDEYHLKQRNKIETLFSLLKGKYNLVSSKARSIEG